LLGLALFVDTVNLNRDKQSLICQFKDRLWTHAN
jgi:hypothetical protein